MRRTGRAFEQQGLNYLQGVQNNVADQVSIRPFTESGDLANFRVRLDARARTMLAALTCTISKLSAGAGFTPNQQIGYPLLEQYGGQVVGGNGMLWYPGVPYVHRPQCRFSGRAASKGFDMGTVVDAGVKTALFKSLRSDLAKHNFSLKATKDTFVRRRGEVTDLFQLVCLDGKPGYRIQPNTGVASSALRNSFIRLRDLSLSIRKTLRQSVPQWGLC